MNRKSTEESLLEETDQSEFKKGLYNQSLLEVTNQLWVSYV